MFNLKNIYKEVENFDGCFNSSFGGSGAAIQEDEKKRRKKIIRIQDTNPVLIQMMQ